MKYLDFRKQTAKEFNEVLKEGIKRKINGRLENANIIYIKDW